MAEFWLAYGPYLCGALGFLALLSFFISFFCIRRLQRLLNLQRQLARQLEDPEFVFRLAALNEDYQETKKLLLELQKRQEEQEEKLRKCVRTPVLKRYNAFADVGGELSFSAVFLDGEGDGFILTGLYGRREARMYAKEVRRGAPQARLAKEEEEVLAAAKQGG
ncbi:hypothetical protein Adeg_2143 [Ammonifex degensii KC4]|uniref:DUF4446 family protein n=1 Tax=Ammonifex degensii (strain DSM 10501 / KC4) TaxID=429009 RepID=C9RAH4_AMMDK|nr:DUF4446 family protein [Ammonifex degensii]ACX53220.1 hypothetical protein Adeg_2143 [Ammonifex degensii KC4]